jgi:hypothetical protein
LRYRILSSTGDMTFGNGLNNFYINVPAAVAQAVRTGLLLWQGEWSFDTSAGTPYLGGILGKHSQNQADTTVQSQIIQVTGVTGIQTFSSGISNRAYSVQTNVDTQYGPTPVDMLNYVYF